jgi:3-dehydroquinate synthase
LLDIVGFSASAYRRGTPFVRVPTTLIGLVDAGVGVKTGINFHGHKNRLGSYFAAGRTLLDRTFLKTLDRRHISNGLAEILKIALVKDSGLFDLLEQHGPALLDSRLQGDDPPYHWEHVSPHERLRAPLPERNIATEVVERAVHGMLEELAPNLWEQVLERVVDYGHTFSPTIEMRALPELLHGEAVTIDMALTTVLAEHRGQVSSAQRSRILELIRVLELPTWHPLCTPDVLLPALRDTVRHRGGTQRLPLPIGIGAAVFVNNVSEQEIVRASATLTDLEAHR